MRRQSQNSNSYNKMREKNLGYTFMGNSESKNFLNCAIGSKVLPIFLDWADFAMWWSSIWEGLLTTGLPCRVFSPKASGWQDFKL